MENLLLKYIQKLSDEKLLEVVENPDKFNGQTLKHAIEEFEKRKLSGLDITELKENIKESRKYNYGKIAYSFALIAMISILYSYLLIYTEINVIDFRIGAYFCSIFFAIISLIFALIARKRKGRLFAVRSFFISAITLALVLLVIPINKFVYPHIKNARIVKKIIPVFVGDPYVSFFQSFEGYSQSNSRIVSKKIADGLICYYHIKSDRNYISLLKTNHIKSKSLKKVHEIAIRNLESKIDDIQIIETTTGCLGISNSKFGYDASLILLPEIWDKVENRLGKEILFAVPSTNFVLFVSRKDPNATNKLLETIELVKEEKETLLTEKLFTYYEGNIELFDN